MQYRAAFDLGETSIGWALYRLEMDKNGAAHPIALVDLGVRLFENGRDPQTKASLGSLRRAPRGARRRRDRFLQRRQFLYSLLEQFGLMPTEKSARAQFFALDPYALRSRAISGGLSMQELGRVIVHLNQRRGFKSNRIADRDDAEDGKIASASAALKSELEAKGFATLGAFLADRQSASKVRDRNTVRIRLGGKGAAAAYEFYPQRDMVEHEFDTVWAVHAAKYPSHLSDQRRQQLKSVLFFQRDLRPVPPGRCTFFPDEPRLAKSRTLAQEFVIYQKLNQIRVGDEGAPLTLAQRDELAALLMSGKSLKWDRIRKTLKLHSGVSINLEEGGEKELVGNPIPGRFAGTKSKPGPFPGDAWLKLSRAVQDGIIEKCDSTGSPEELAEWGKAAFGLDQDAASRLAKVRLPDKHVNVSACACSLIVEQLKKDVVVYSEACTRAGLDHSDFEDGEFFDHLPPYNRILSMQRHLGFGTGDPDDPPDRRHGRIANPTVHIALNQLRRVLNEIIDRHGKPTEIVLEIARDLRKSQREKDAIQRENEANRKANAEMLADLEKEGLYSDGDRGVGEKLLRMKLWKELGEPQNRRCPYTGEMISLQMLFSDAVEIEHILPLSRTLDDSPANLTVALRIANRLKRNLAPDEAAARFPEIFDKEAMKERTRSMPANKRWRFDDGAMRTFEEQKSFVDRQLRSTQYLSRIAREYASKLFPVEENGVRRTHVWVVTGALTFNLRRKWGLNLGDHNRKNRDDHRHHALDAAVIGVTDRSLVQRLSTIAAREEAEGVDRFFADLEEPYFGFREQVMASVEKLRDRISHRAQHGRIDPSDPTKSAGRLHEDTNYGLVKDKPENAKDLERGNVVRRKAVTDLTPTEIEKIRDLALQKEIAAAVAGASDDKARAAALAAWSEKTGVRRVRLLKQEAGVVAVKNRKTGLPYRYVSPAENAWIDIVETADGVWRGVAVDIFSAHRGGGKDWRTEHPDAKFIMRLRKGDTVRLFDDDGTNRVKKIFRIGVKANVLYLAPIADGGDLQKRHDDSSDPFRWDFANIGKLKDRRAQRVRFTVAGRLKTVPLGEQ